MKAHRLQSAMEYLMTYGWAILIIAVVLGALFQLGIFGNSTSTSQSSCLANPGFLCSNPTLNSSGYLAVKFGQIGTGSITITGIACTSTASAPSTTNSISLTLPSGSTAIVAFSCPISTASIGSGFKGYLWMVYNTQTQTGLVDRIASVSASVATSGSVIAALGGGVSAIGASVVHDIYCVGGYGFSSVYYAPIYSNGNIGSWTATNSYPFGGEITSCSVSGNNVYCIGGYSTDTSSYVSTSYYAPLFSGGVGSWSSITSYPVGAVMNPSECGISGSNIFCAGGSTGSTYLAGTYYATVSSNSISSWSAGTSLSVNTITQCPIYGGYMYCVDGYVSPAYVANTYYAPVSSSGIGAWSSTTPYPSTGSQPCVTSGGYIYCIAGYTGSSAVSAVYYAPISFGGIGTWTSSTAYPIVNYGFPCVVGNGNVYCVGGDSGGSGKNNVYYAPLSSSGVGAWITANTYPILARYLSCVVN